MDELFGMRVRVERVAWRMTANAERRYRRIETVSWPPGAIHPHLEEPGWTEEAPIEHGATYRFSIPKSQRFMAPYPSGPGEVLDGWPGIGMPGSDETLPKVASDEGVARIRRVDHDGLVLRGGETVEYRSGVVVGMVKRTEGIVWPQRSYADDWESGGATAERVYDLFVVALEPGRLLDGPQLRYVAPDDIKADPLF